MHPRSQCRNCAVAPPRFTQLRSWCAFEAPIRPALHKLKYRHDLGLSEALIPQLTEFVIALDWSVDVAMPVPLGSRRYRERGYNQAGLISWPLALALGIRHTSHALSRSRETPSQVGLTRAGRQKNVHRAFVASPESVNGRSILLVDDVATTGATLSSCADALFAAGARDVFSLTVARAIHGPAGDV